MFLLLLQLSNSVALAKRGDCPFTTKAVAAQLGGAVGLLVINDNEGINSLHTQIILCLYLIFNLSYTVSVVLILACF